MAARSAVPSKTEILGFLRECGFDPRNQAEMRSLTIVSRPDYCETRAMELVIEAQLAMNVPTSSHHYDQCIMKAIQLLTLARMVRIRETNAKKDGSDRR